MSSIPSRLLACSLAPFLLAGCGKQENPEEKQENPEAKQENAQADYWEGKGTAKEIVIEDEVRKLTRSVEHEFWFNVSRDGAVSGEIELTYDSRLIVSGLPAVSVGVVSFEPEVGGEITDLNPTRTFPLVGTFANGTLTLEIATPEKDREPIEFTIRADPGVSAGIGAGGLSTSVSGKRTAKAGVIEVPMTPFSPFTGAADVEKRASGPFAASFQKVGKTSSVQWSARQVRSVDRSKRPD